jgi:hypothetical protein
VSNRKGWVYALGVFVCSAWLAGCSSGGGQNGGSPPPPPPPPTKTVTSVDATCTPTTLQLVASGSQPTSQCTATVSYSDGTSSSPSSLVTWAAAPSAAGTISATGLFTPSTSIASTTQVTVTATSTENTAIQGTATITVNPVLAVAPTITGLPSTATVAFGTSANFTFTVTGTPDPTVTCTVTGTGTCSISGSTVVYTLPNPASAPASFVDTLTVTVQNSAGSASATVTINLVASITSATVHGSVDPQAVFCARYNCPVVVDMVGTGFFASDGFLQDLVAPVNGTVNAAFNITDSAHASLTALVGKGDFRPKAWHIGIREPGPCCGFDSNVVNFVFLGNLDTMDISTSRNQADQLTQSSGIGKVIDLSSGNTVGNFGEALVSSLAVDDTTGYIATTEPTGFDFIDPSTGNFLPIGGGNGQLALAVSAKGGYMCGSQDQAGQIVSLQLVPNNGTLVPLIVGNTPWQTAMLTLNNQLVCTVFNIGDLVFTVAPIPIPATPAPLWTLTVAGLTPLSQIPTANSGGQIVPNGGWPLIVSQSASKAAILSRYDRKVAIIDLLAKTQMLVNGAPTVDLSPHLGGGIILRMAVDDTHQRAVISLAQTATETSTFLSMDLNTGAVSPMSATTPFYATDLRVSADGTTLYCGDSAGQFLRVPNQ